MTTVHIMLDLETWGTTPGSDIRSIGACVFDPATGIVGNDAATPEDEARLFYIATENLIDTASCAICYAIYSPMSFDVCPECGNTDREGEERAYPLTRDPKTVQWWSEQSEEAQAAFTNPVELREALQRFGDWYFGLEIDAGNNKQTLTLWSHGSHFDVPILAAAYAACNLPVPWHYRAPRDTRTAFDMAGITDHSAWLDQHATAPNVHHHALHDAIVQARAVCGAFRLVQRWRNTSYSDDALPSYMNNIVNAIEDEGDRVYFGSTNDADHLRQIASDLDADRFERDCDT